MDHRVNSDINTMQVEELEVVLVEAWDLEMPARPQIKVMRILMEVLIITRKIAKELKEVLDQVAVESGKLRIWDQEEEETLNYLQ